MPRHDDVIAILCFKEQSDLPIGWFGRDASSDCGCLRWDACLILCIALGQKAYLALEMAELAFQTWNIIGLTITSRTLVETAAMVSALAADPKQASKILTKQTETGMSRLDFLSNGNPTIISDSWAVAMSSTKAPRRQTASA